MIEIKEFTQAVKYTKNADCTTYATIPSLTKMLGCRRIEVMQYLEDHPDLVHTEERFRSKTVNEKTYPPVGKPYNIKVAARGASLGLCIIDAYERPELNPWNELWLKETIKKYSKTVWVSEWSNYGQIEGLFLARTSRPSSLKENELYKDNRRNDFLWKNTEEKLEAAKTLGATFETTYYIGGFGDCSQHKIPYGINQKGIQMLRDNRWTVILPETN